MATDLLTREELESLRWTLTPMGQFINDERGELADLHDGAELRPGRSFGHLLTAAPKLALACLEARQFIAHWDLAKLAHLPMLAAEASELQASLDAALAAAGVEVP
jgi:hypothetical protein